MAQKFEFLFILPDGPGAAENRKVTTDLHEEFVARTKDFWLAGGPIFADHRRETPARIQGSWVLLEASSQEEAVELLQRDPFTTGNVWDWNKAQTLHVKSGLRVPFVKDSIQRALDETKVGEEK
ncbi:MAG: hypothetical protein LQ340_000799 [Diploschistes diacapsis]|nr:MAG: hypothetical protein LQ340_000799 [Diploschistes diacapsis]